MNIGAHIEADQSPGGLVFILYVDGDVGLVQKIGATDCMRDDRYRDTIILSADYGAEFTLAQLRAGKTVTLVVYDGDSGAPVFATRKVLSG